LMQAIEWSVNQSDQGGVVLFDGPGNTGVPYLARSRCITQSERCFFQDIDPCKRQHAAVADFAGVRFWGWNKPPLPRINSRERLGAHGTWLASVPAQFGSHSLLWWQSQIFLFFLQPRAHTQQLLDDWLAARHGMRTGNSAEPLVLSSWEALHPFVFMHVRWGDKCGLFGGNFEAACRPAKYYVAAAEGLRAKHNVSRLVLSSSSQEAFEAFPRMMPDWEIIWTGGQHIDLTVMKQANRTSRAREDISGVGIVELFIAAAADFLICTPSSNWARVIIRMAYGMYNRLPKMAFLDEWGWDNTLDFETALEDGMFRRAIVQHTGYRTLGHGNGGDRPQTEANNCTADCFRLPCDAVLFSWFNSNCSQLTATQLPSLRRDGLCMRPNRD
jgi:hypothetical protein